MVNWLHKLLDGLLLLMGQGREYELPYDDADALRSDWQAVGDDIRKAIEQYEVSINRVRKE